MANIREITASAWQFSLQGVGVIVEGLADVRQCIDVILRTQKGTDPFRPQFGSDIFDHMDKPVQVAVPNIKMAIIEAIDMWEPRVKVKAVSHTYNVDGANSQIIFHIVYNIVDEDLLDSLQLTLDGSILTTDGGTVNKLILEALIPSGSRFYLSMVLDGSNTLPVPPATGFATILELYTWVNEYWGLYGTWYYLQLQGKIVVYINAGVAQTGSLNITSPNYILSATIPPIQAGEFYTVIFTVNGVPVVPPFPAETAETAEHIIVWILANWGQYGQWSVIGDELMLVSDTILNNATLQVIASGGSAFTIGFSTGFKA